MKNLYKGPAPRLLNPALRYFMGVDPGGSGAIALIDENREALTAARLDWTMRDIWEWLQPMPEEARPIQCVLEKVASMPKQGVASSFKFGISFGLCRMALIAAKIPFDECVPNKWQRKLSIPVRGKKSKTQHKQALKALAQQLFPDVEVTNRLADALLIAEYCRREF